MVAALTVLATSTACEGLGLAADPRVGDSAVAALRSTPASSPTITVTPSAGATDVHPGTRVRISVAQGGLSVVAVTDTEGRSLPGERTADRSGWVSRGPLALATTYTARVTAVGASGRATTTARFTTLVPRKTLQTSISPLDGSTVGVGMPIVVRLSEAVGNRAAVQHALQVNTAPAVEGAWSWIDEDEVQWRPRAYWPPGATVRLQVGLTGVGVGRDVWGDETRTIRFSVGRSMVSLVDVRRKIMTVRRDGRLVRTIPVTTGKAGFLTRNGIKVISEKHRWKIMDAATGGTRRDSEEYYRLRVPYAMRVTWSGEFVHAAPWSEGQQGRINVSHGCVGMSMVDGRWLYQHSNVGDVVRVVGSSRGLEPGNGYTAWNVPWQTWLAGSVR